MGLGSTTSASLTANEYSSMPNREIPALFQVQGYVIGLKTENALQKMETHPYL